MAAADAGVTPADPGLIASSADVARPVCKTAAVIER
jgi:hypothetical protein